MRPISSATNTNTFNRTFEMSGKTAAPRRGTSLMEVLAAILIMSVGVLSVMTLFPISIIRSIQATNLTNVTILSKRADALIDMYGLVTDNYIPQPAEGYEVHAVIDPLGWHDLEAAFGPPAPLMSWPLAQEYGNDGAGNVVRYSPRTPPVFLNESGAGGQNRFVDRAPASPPSGPLSPGGQVPLRRISYAVNPINPGQPVFPQPYPPSPTATQSPFFTNTPGGASPTARDFVLSAVGLPDSFKSLFEGQPDAIVPGPPQAVTFSATQYDLSFAETHPAGFPGSSNPAQETNLVPRSRVVLIDDTGKRSQIREVTYDGTGAPNGVAIYPTGTDWVIAWADPLPGDFTTVSEARIEIPEARYTWLLTVRKKGTTGGSVTEIDCVTFFNRKSEDPSQELVYAAFSPDDVRDPSYLTPYPAGNERPSPLVTILHTGGIEPPVKKGGFIFDPTNCLWYRVLDVKVENPTAATPHTVVQLERNIESSTPIANVIVPEGVVNVFPLPSRVDQSRLNQARRVGR